MKRIFFALALVLTLGLTAQAAGQKHRHHQTVTATATLQQDSANAGITAYSDTTDASSDSVDTASSSDFNNDNDNSGMPNFNFDFGNDAIGIAIIISVLLPFLIVALLFYFIYRNRKMRYQLAEKALEKGQPLPQQFLKEERQNDDYLWRKGIRKSSIGIGLVFFFWILGAEELIGIGLLVFFIGVGQAVVAKTTSNPRKSDYNNRQSEQVQHQTETNNNSSQAFDATQNVSPNDNVGEETTDKEA